MGDEMHQRNVACSSLLLRALAPALARTTKDAERWRAASISSPTNDQFFLNVAMAMGKAMTDPRAASSGSTVVTAMSRNGTEFGIRVTGTGDAWFTGAVEMPTGLYFPGFTRGGRQPGHGRFRDRRDGRPRRLRHGGGAGGGRASSARAPPPRRVDCTRRWRRSPPARIRNGRSRRSTSRACRPASTSAWWSRRGSCPSINTGIAHREPGIGQVGAGIARAPMACFAPALEALPTEERRDGGRPATRSAAASISTRVALMRIGARARGAARRRARRR